MTPDSRLLTPDSGLKTILVTGGCGFIGTNLVKHLADRGCQIKILDNLSAGKEENLKLLQSQDCRFSDLELVIGDIRNRDEVRRMVKGVDAVVHLAAHTSVVESLEKPKENWDVNVNGTLNLLEACRQNGVSRFIFASSNAVVGEQSPPIDELKIPKPLSPYGASKLAGEALCSTYYHSFGLETVALRFANCYGPYSDHKTSVVARFLELAKEDKPLTIYGDGKQTRDFVHADDVCQAIYLSLVAEDSVFGEVFQIASGLETSINKLAGTLREVTKRNLQIIYEPERAGEIKRNYSDISKAKRVLGFEPVVKLREGLHSLQEWHREANH